MADDIEQKIRERAYHLWLESGGGEGQADRHWLAAEREVLAAFAVSAPVTPPRDPPSAIQAAHEPKVKQRASGKARRGAR